MTEPDAAEIYSAAAEDRTEARTGLRWMGTVIMGLLSVHDAPAMSDVVIRRRDDGTEVRRFSPAMLGEVEDTLIAILRDLDAQDVETFEEEWLSPDEASDESDDAA